MQLAAEPCSDTMRLVCRMILKTDLDSFYLYMSLGALYWNDFLRLAKECGFLDPRMIKDSPITIENDAMKTLLGPIEFYSATYRYTYQLQLTAHIAIAMNFD